LIKGITGVVMDPFQGIKKDGVEGLFMGVGKGLLGAAVKSGAGVFDLATRTTQGIRNTTTLFDSPKKRERVRSPRYIGPEKRLQVFSHEKGYGQALLLSLEYAQFRGEWHQFHQNLPSGQILLGTNNHIFVIQNRKNQFVVERKASFRKIKKNLQSRKIDYHY